jgi:hypothetical protein
MPINLRNALDEWTNSKPPKVLEKSVSEALRTLPFDPSVATDLNKDIQKLENIRKTLAAALSNQALRAQKEALFCLTAIIRHLVTQLQRHKQDRTKVIAALKRIQAEGLKFHKMTETPPTKEQVGNWGKHPLFSAIQAWTKLCPSATFRPDDADFEQVPHEVGVMAHQMLANYQSKVKYTVSRHELMIRLNKIPSLLK